MKKVWNTLVVLGILLCMIMSLGVTADAAEGDSAVFAVSGVQLPAESVNEMKTQCPDCLVVDVDGLADGQSAAGYNVVYARSDPGVMADYAYIWPGFAQMFYVGTQSRLVVLVGVGDASTAEEISGAIGGYLGDNPYVIAVGPASAAAAVGGCADVDMFMTSGLDDASASAAASAAGAAKLVNVGQQSDYPVSLVKVNGDGSASAEAIPVPQPAADPGVVPAEPETADPNGDPAVDPAVDQPAIEEQPTDGTAEGAGDTAEQPEQVTYCKIIYDGNGRDEGSVPDVLDFIAGQVHFLSNNGYSRNGYQFIGWKVEGDDTLYQPGDEVVVDHDVTVYAQWEEIPAEPADEPATEGEPTTEGEPAADPAAVTVTFVPGEGAVGAEQTFTGTSDTLFGMIDMPADFAREGFTFIGWLMDGQHYDVGAPFSVTENKTITADWSQNPPAVKNAVITFDANGGTNQTGDPDTQTVTDIGEGVSYGLPANWYTPPEGKVFDAWEVNGATYAERQEILLTGDITVKALWKDVAPEQTAPVAHAVTYRAGIEGVDDVAGEAKIAGDVFKLADCTFAVPSHTTFGGWKQEGTENVVAAGADFTMPEADVVFVAQWQSVAQYNVTFRSGVENGPADIVNQLYADETVTLPGDIFTVDGKILSAWRVEGTETDLAIGSTQTLTGDVIFVAQWKDKAPEVFKVTFKSGVDGGPADIVLEANANDVITMDADKFAVDGKTLTGWKVNEDGGVLLPGETYTVTADVTLTAQWEDVKPQDPGLQGEAAISWTSGSGNALSVNFSNAAVSAVLVGNEELKKDVQYTLSNGDKTLTFDKSYLDSLEAGNYAVEISFLDNNGVPYEKKVMTLAVTVPATEEPANPDNMELTWAERSAYLSITFDAQPVKLEIDYGSSGFKETKVNDDYTVDGNTLFMQPNLINKNWGGAWPNARYAFRVTLADGTTKNLKITLSGDIPQATATATPAPTAAATATPAPTAAGPTSPATGDTNNITLYIVILVVLIAALAAVLIVVMKRKKQ